MVGVEGLEPPTLGLEIRCSIQLSYTPTQTITIIQYDIFLKLAEFISSRCSALRPSRYHAHFQYFPLKPRIYPLNTGTTQALSRIRTLPT